jgi:uncharacterized protein HemY
MCPEALVTQLKKRTEENAGAQELAVLSKDIGLLFTKSAKYSEAKAYLLKALEYGTLGWNYFELAYLHIVLASMCLQMREFE